MEDRRMWEGTPGTEGGRSPSGVPGVAAPSGGATGSGSGGADWPPGEGPAVSAEESGEGPGGGNEPGRPLHLIGPKKGRRLEKKAKQRQKGLTGEQRLRILDTWQRSGLPAADFATLVGVSKHTLYTWKKRFEESGPAGLMDRPRRGVKGSRLPEITKRAILMIKDANPAYGCQRISDI